MHVQKRKFDYDYACLAHILLIAHSDVFHLVPESRRAYLLPSRVLHEPSMITPVLVRIHGFDV